MKMEVKLLSRDTIKPSSRTPPNLETFRLLCLEKLSPLVYTPLFLFYPKKNNNDLEETQAEAAITILKSSLSETLNRFLFLEGEIVNKSIYCNYEGVIFVKARVSGRMFDILKEPNNDAVLIKLVMYSTLWTDPNEKYAQIAVQANIFDCGGVAISLCLLHELMDATTLSCFLRSWVAINTTSFNSVPSIACSDFGPLSSLFDPRRRPEAFSSNSQQKGCFQRLVFKDTAIPILKAKAESSDVQNPTCVEVLLGSIWKCALDVLFQSSQESHRPSVLTRAINLHNKMQPSIPRFSVGNFWWIEVAHYLSNGTTQVELSDLVRLLRESFEENNGDYWVKTLVANNEGTKVITKLPSAEIIPKLYICTNWESIELNEVDFGWEIAIWIGTLADSNTTSKNNINILLRAISGNEIEIWIVLDDEEIELLVQNKEFRDLVDLTFP